MQSKPLVLGIGLLVLIVGATAFYYFKPIEGGFQVQGSGDQGTATTTGSTSGSTSGSTTNNPATTAGEQHEINISAMITAMANNLYQDEKFYLVDDSVIFVARTGNAADASYSHVLMDKNLNQICTLSDSIAGPRESCTDSSKKAEFDIMTANLDKTNLGLTGHTVVLLYQTRSNPQ